MSRNLSNEPTLPDQLRTGGRIGRSGLAALAVAALLLGSLAFAPVRAVAAAVLGIFRVQRVQTISITQADLEKLGQVLAEGNGSVSLESLGDVSVEGGSSEPSETTLEAARGAIDFDLKTPVGVEGTPTVVLQVPMTIKFKLHIDKVNELLESYGATKLFTNALDGKEFSIYMPAAVVLAYPDGTAVREARSDETDPDMMKAEGAALSSDPTLGLVVAQTRGPQLNVPAGVNPLEIRDVLLGLPFLPEGIRSQLAGVQDWQNTLLIPNVDGTSREISVAGMPGVIITPQGGVVGGPGEPLPDEAPVVVMWNDNGVMRAVGGVGGEKRILGIAETVTR